MVTLLFRFAPTILTLEHFPAKAKARTLRSSWLRCATAYCKARHNYQHEATKHGAEKLEADRVRLCEARSKLPDFNNIFAGNLPKLV